MPSTHTHSNGALLKSDKAAPTLPPLTLWQHLGQAYSQSHHSIIHAVCIAPKSHYTYSSSLPSTEPWAFFLSVYFLMSYRSSHIVCSLFRLAFFFSSSNMHFNFSHVFSWFNGSFLFNEPNTVSLSGCTTFAHSSVEEHLAASCCGGYE